MVINYHFYHCELATLNTRLYCRNYADMLYKELSSNNFIS